MSRMPSPLLRPSRLLLSSLGLLVGASLSLGQPLGNPTAQQEEADLEQQLQALRQQIVELNGSLDSLLDDASDGEGHDPEKRMEWWKQHEAAKAASPFKDLGWQFIGPTNIGGRVTDVAVPGAPGQGYGMYVATASGGVWRTKNEGTTWEEIFGDAPTASIGDLALSPSEPEHLWVGTGEANIFRSSMAGAGVWLSKDKGETWEHKGLTATQTISRVLVHPADPNTVYVAASGHEWTDNHERGVYRTRDAGETWEHVLFVDDRTGAIDLVMDPVDPGILYAATWERIRRRWNDPRNEEGYGQSSIWRSMDGGETWVEAAAGLPEGQYRGRIGIDVARSNPEVLYAFVDNYELVELDPDEEGETDSYGREREAHIKGAEVYRSNDRGVSWSKVSESNDYMEGLSSTYGWVFGQIRVDPKNEERIYIMGLGLNVSDDGGKTFRRLRGMHGDHHALWIDPNNTDHLVNGNDGGVYVSYDAGANWRSFTDRLNPVQFYNVGYDMSEPFRVYGSIQDHGSRSGVVDLSSGRDRVRPVEFDYAPGGEASYHQVDPTDEAVVYSAGFYGRVNRSDLRSGERARLALEAENEEGEEDDGYSIAPEAELRGQWLAPFMISPHNPRILYHGMNKLFRSMDRGEGIEAISADLSRNDPSELGDIPYQTITSLSESPLKFGLLYAGTDDGRAHCSPDGGTTWIEITAGLAIERWVSRVVASRYDENTVYLAQNGKRWDDFRTYLWRSTDRGQTWQPIGQDIPCGPVNVIAEDPKDSEVLYVGTDLGVYLSVDRARSWQPLGANLPTTYVHDLVVHPRDDMIVIATHGRGMWVMDARPIQTWGDPVKEEPAAVEPTND